MATPGSGSKWLFTPSVTYTGDLMADPAPSPWQWQPTGPTTVSITLDADTIERIAARVVDILADRAASKAGA
jgi:hypothetical protein